MKIDYCKRCHTHEPDHRETEFNWQKCECKEKREPRRKKGELSKLDLAVRDLVIKELVRSEIR